MASPHLTWALLSPLILLLLTVVFAPQLQALTSYLETSPRTPLSITATRQLDCGDGAHDVISGWVHLPTGDMFWSLFQARRAAPGLVVHFQGGPGMSAFDHAFLGAGPCQLTKGANATLAALTPAPYPWTAHASLLVVDYPVGTGFSSYADPRHPRIAPNTSAAAAQDFDSFLQTFLTEFSNYATQPLVLHSVSYGGTYVPHIASVVNNKNEERSPGRIAKNIDAIVLGNPLGDMVAEMTWQYTTMCVDEPRIWGEYRCGDLLEKLPACQDALALAIEDNTTANRLNAREKYDPFDEDGFKLALRNRYDRREEHCVPIHKCFWWFEPLQSLMNTEPLRRLLGAPPTDVFQWPIIGPASVNFYNEADHYQSAYRLLTPALEAGTRLFVYSGKDDTICGWRSTLSWMRRLDSPHRAAFNNASFVPLLGGLAAGDVIGAGTDFTLLRVDDAGHLVEFDQPALVQAIIAAAVKGRNYNPLVTAPEPEHDPWWFTQWWWAAHFLQPVR
ncbi:Carboxypeptidase Y [Vanrija pseudolonga]|uniref:Carboxypeptidase Y n=1 Tax=Vanrija pseudolonga TaxID=143232 RepID=A0AAF0Y549_9TREE|nr:Carboxypeptidase Y [Vanrija pseudolonga]